MSRDLERVERLLRNLKQLLGAHLALIHPACNRVEDVLVRELDVQADLVPLARDDHARAVVRVDGAFAADVGEVRVRDHVNDTPNVICGERFAAVSQGIMAAQ